MIKNKFQFFTPLFLILFFVFLFGYHSLAATINDKDHDGLSNEDEINIYHTDPNNPDTDGDGYNDGVEIKNGYNPLSANPIKLIKKIKIDLKKQELSYFLGDIKLGKFRVSTGKWTMPTPKGTFKILNKIPRAWSKDYGLWMPYWLGLASGKFGIHELPEWPNGTKEGENHLGTPVSHGCIRLGVGPAKTIYDWATIGMSVEIN
jgi:lipoprotein-anchoring transpeptidase ErfK/SrfK